MVESEIIPRLMRAHPRASDDAETPDDHDHPLGAESTEAFVKMVLSRNADALTQFMATVCQGGVDMLAIYSDLLAPTARRLTELWSEDLVSFTEVTLGLNRLQHLVRGLEANTPYNGDNDPGSRSIMFAPRPGEQQTFGFYIIEELFRWSGWRGWIETSTTNEQMASNVRLRWYDMFCLSVSRESHIEEVTATIKAVRRASRNRDLFVLVNGRPFVEHPDWVGDVGADASASGAGEALQIADKAVWRAATA